MIFKFRLF